MGSADILIGSFASLSATAEFWKEVFAARCADTNELAKDDERKYFVSNVLQQQKPGTLSLRNLRVGAHVISCLGLYLEERYDSTTIDLSENILKDNAMTSMRGLLKAFPCLRTLNLSGNLLGAEGMAGLAEALGAAEHLSRLIVGRTVGTRNNLIGDEGLHILTKKLQCPNLTSLSLCNTGLTAACVTSLEVLLKRGLVQLTVSHNELKNEGITTLLPLCKRKVRLLDISHTGCSGDIVYLPLVRLLEQTSTLSVLALSGIRGNGFARRIADPLGRCAVLSTLVLRHCSISSPNMVRAFTSSIAASPTGTLTNLDLSFNRIVGTTTPSANSAWPPSASSAAHAIALLVRRCPNLRTLKLNHNPLGDVGSQPLADALGNAEVALKVLELDGIKLCAGGLTYLLSRLVLNTHLRTLKLEDNFITDLSEGKKTPVTPRLMIATPSTAKNVKGRRVAPKKAVTTTLPSLSTPRGQHQKHSTDEDNADAYVPGTSQSPDPAVHAEEKSTFRSCKTFSITLTSAQGIMGNSAPPNVPLQIISRNSASPAPAHTPLWSTREAHESPDVRLAHTMDDHLSHQTAFSSPASGDDTGTSRRPLTTTEEWCHLLSQCKMHECALAKGNRVSYAIVRHVHNVCARNRRTIDRDSAYLALKAREPLEQYLKTAQEEVRHVKEAQSCAKKDLASSKALLSARVREMDKHFAVIEGDMQEERRQLQAAEQMVRDAEARLQEAQESKEQSVAHLTLALQDMMRELSDVQTRDEAILKRLAEIESRKKKKTIGM